MIIKDKKIGVGEKTFFIADIAANHDGNLNRAIELIKLSAEAGADAAKFQHFKAETIVSDYGFKNLNIKTHQSKWKESVFNVYKKASIDPKEIKTMVASIRNITQALGDGKKKVTKSECKNLDIARPSIVAACFIKKGDKFNFYSFENMF